MKKLVIVMVASLAALLAVSCGSDDGGGSASGSCSAVCSCVVDQGGDLNTCNDECAKTQAAGGNQKASCEAKLDGFGYPVCKPKCEGFPTS